MSDSNRAVREIGFGDLLDIFKKHFAVIIIAGALGALLVFLACSITFVPAYDSTATLYILRQNEESQSSSAVVSDFSLALNVVNDCTYILKMQSVLDEVIDELKLDTDYEHLRKCISTNNPQGTRILEVKAVAATPALAKNIVDSVCRIGAQKISESMGFEQVNISEYGNLSDKPCNRVRLYVYAIVGLLTAVVTYIVFLVLSLLDDGIRSDEDVRRYLGLSVLGKIPDVNAPHNRHYGYYGYGYGKKPSQNGKTKG